MIVLLSNITRKPRTLNRVVDYMCILRFSSNIQAVKTWFEKCRFSLFLAVKILCVITHNYKVKYQIPVYISKYRSQIYNSRITSFQLQRSMPVLKQSLVCNINIFVTRIKYSTYCFCYLLSFLLIVSLHGEGPLPSQATPC